MGYPADAGIGVEHTCHVQKTCSCSVQALEPNEDCPVHGHDPRQRCSCGRFVKLAEPEIGTGVMNVTNLTTTADGFKSDVVIIPENHVVTGTCGKCGGPIISPIWFNAGNDILEWCMHCGAKPKPPAPCPTYGPVKEMQ